MRKDVFEKAVMLRADGKTLVQIAAEIGYGTSTLSKAFHDAGMTSATSGYRLPSPELLQKISKGLEAGRTYVQIADDLGLRRNQVAGLINRNLRSHVRRQPVADKSKSALTTRDDTSRRVSGSRKVADDAPAPLQLASQPVPVASSPVAFAVAGPGICHWPLWSANDALSAKDVCGNDCGRETYCPGHRALAYRPADARRRAA